MTMSAVAPPPSNAGCTARNTSAADRSGAAANQGAGHAANRKSFVEVSTR